MKLQEFFSGPEKWTQKCYENHTGACCLMGAIYLSFKDAEVIKLIEKVREELGTYNIVGWNDDPKRTFKDIQQLVKKLNI